MGNLVATTHFLPGWRVKLFGRQPTLGEQPGKNNARQHIHHMTFLPRPSATLLVKPPAPKISAEAQHQRSIVVIDSLETILAHDGYIIADAVIITPAYLSCLAMQSRDCPVVCLVNKMTGSVAVVHCMRDLLKKTHKAPVDILSEVVQRLAPTPADRAHLYVHISASIGAAYFTHDQTPEKVDHFFRRFGWAVFTSHTHYSLCLPTSIRFILTQELLVPSENINWDKLCTYKNESLGSFRKGKPGQNLTCLAPARTRLKETSATTL